ncbi:MAG: DUF3040 domain-containing protein [Streptomyces sp.]|nr:DUF3040 domain-containing protein [Streptomyces sp.]
MVLSLHERRVIADLERSLTREDPRLSKTLADFGRTRPQPLHAPAPAEPEPEERAGGERARRITTWSSVLALVLLFSALALSAAGLLLAASVAALAGVVCWAVYRGGRHRQQERPPGSEPGG